MLKFAAILGKMENGCDLAAKYLQFYSFQKGKTVNLSYGKKKVIEEILSISYNQFKEVFDWYGAQNEAYKTIYWIKQHIAL